jgi:thiamine-monophosphate kinase
MDEFDIIRKYFVPLATSPGADGLRDDVAEIGTLGGGVRLIATKDAITEGVHFLPSDPVDTVARKLVRVNVSDIIAKGARPDGALLALLWPGARPGDEIGAFAQALGEDLAQWGAHLLGGDTTSTEGPLTLSLTMLGRCGPRGPVRRSGAQAGNDLWVTGVIGDGWLGLQAAKGALAELSDTDRAFLVSRYRVPGPPPLAVADLVAGFATSSIDVSDGLVADAAHLADASRVSIVIHAGDVPLGAAARGFLASSAGDLRALLTGGDDYQTLFTAPSERRGEIQKSGLTLTRIGQVEAGAGVRVLGASGEPMALEKTGWAHFSG